MSIKYFAFGLLILSTFVNAQDPCEQIKNHATWENTSLYHLTYQCTPLGWESFFNDEKVRKEIKTISDKLQKEIQSGNEINPAIGDTFRALYSVPTTGIKAVILGQDPAPTKGKATGLSFSLSPETPSHEVPSVQRVILEAMNEGYALRLSDGDLSFWADNGVLLLNAALTIPCKKNAPSCTIAGHLTLWKNFSKQLIDNIDQQNSAFTFILWGSKADQLSSRIKNPLHRIIKGGHPSPLAAATQFFCKSYFTCTNKWLEDHQTSTVDWNVPEGIALPMSCIWSKGQTPKCLSKCVPVDCN